jgi:hypothetical protein
MDYDLSRLSSRSFEQLVQALAVRHLGPGVVIFGDGADGGREATFQGDSSFAPHGTPWTGHCIVQAKFRQRPLGTEIDGPWALTALDGELTKFAKQEGGRTRPDCYIFATNAVLSPGVGGTKDQADKKLVAACTKWGLQDYELWDYDKLRTWLDIDQETRTRFGWITAGDVLGAMLKTIEGCTPDFERAITNFLEKTLVADRFVRLEEAGHSADAPTPLSNVFIDLPIVGESTAGGSLFMDRLLNDCATLQTRDGDERNTEHRIVLVGGPGQGKTTVGQFACQIFRASLLASRPPQSLSAEGRAAVSAIRAACDSEGLDFARAPRFPIRVVLTDLAKALSETNQTLLTYLSMTISERVGINVPTELFRKWLSLYPWLLVLDGLDEVPAAAGREQMMRCITDFWVDAAQANADVVVLATTRPQGYNNDFSPERYEHLTLAELTPQRALDYGSRLADARYGNTSDRTVTVKTRLTKAAADPTTAHLMRSPLQVAIMAALVDRYGQPPHERWSLFDAYYDVIYQRERERETDAAQILREYRPDIDAIHQYVGLTLQVLTTHEGHADPRLTGTQLEALIDARLASEGHEGPGTSAMAAQIRSAAELRLVFLVGAQSDRIGFEIRSLQEFMAAGALVDGPDEEVIQRLAAIAPLPAWRNVLLFAAGECFVGRQYLRKQIHAMCRELDVTDPLQEAARTGARLALDLLEDRTARRQPAHHRVIAAHALEVLSTADMNAPTRLARCHDDKVDDLYKAAIDAAASSGDVVKRSSARRCLLALNQQGVTWSAAMLEQRLPSNATELIDMVDEMPADVAQAINDYDLSGCLSKVTYGELQDLADKSPVLDVASSWSRQQQVPIEPLDLAGLTLNLSPITRTNSGSPGLPTISPLAAIFEGARRFLETPTCLMLSAVLGDVARRSTVEAWRECAHAVPWPMGRALARSESLEELSVECKLVSEGAYGDRPEWEAAEKQWARGPVSLLASLQDAPIMLPVEAMTATMTVPAIHTSAWIETWRTIPDTHIKQRSWLAGLLLWTLGSPHRSRDPRLAMSEFIDIARAAPQGKRYLEIGVLDAEEGDPCELEDLLESLPQDACFYYRDSMLDLDSFRADAELIARLEKHAIAKPSYRAYEVLAVALASSLPVAFKPISLPRDCADPKIQACAAFISLITQAHSAPQRTLGERFGGSDDLGLWSLLESPVAQGSPGWSDFLIGLQATCPRAWRSHRQLDVLFNEVLSRIETPLADARTWQKLGLFQPHPLTLAETD